MSVKPIFILSPPRSGSTLLQRILAVHDKVETVAEPWVLLPVYYAGFSSGIYAEYSHCTSHVAIQDLKSFMKNGDDGYGASVKCFALNIYEQLANDGGEYFIDKTPRYSLIAKEICRDFENDGIIFLWRNPLSIVTSIVSTFLDNKWCVFRYEIDMERGMINLIDAYRENKDSVISLKYEDLVADVDKTVLALGDALGVDYSNCELSSFSDVKLKGRMGDPTGQKKYKSVSGDSVSKWQNIITTSVRKNWCKKYLKRIGSERLNAIGYSYEDLIAQLDSIQVSKFSIQNLKDLTCLAYGGAYNMLSFKIMKDNVRKIRNRLKVYKVD